MAHIPPASIEVHSFENSYCRVPASVALRPAPSNVKSLKPQLLKDQTVVMRIGHASIR